MPSSPAFFDRQPEHIQQLMQDMASQYTVQEIIDAMGDQGVIVNKQNVAYYRRMHNVDCGRNVVETPAKTFTERIGQYITAVKAHNGDMWSNRMIGLNGQTWARCATRMCDDGILKMERLRPARFTQRVTDDEMDNWYDGVKNQSNTRI